MKPHDFLVVITMEKNHYAVVATLRLGQIKENVSIGTFSRIGIG